MPLQYNLSYNLKCKVIAARKSDFKTLTQDRVMAIKRYAIGLAGQDISPEQKLKLIDEAILRANIPQIKFRSLRGKLPEAFRLSALAIYNYCLRTGRTEITIVRPGNGGGRDLFIQHRYLEALGIRPRYILIDYYLEQHRRSQELNPDVPYSGYFMQNLFQPLSYDLLKYIGDAGVDIVDFQQILHEIRSEGCGGSYDDLLAVVRRFSDLLKPGGLMIGEDVNIVEENYGQDIKFTLSEEFNDIFKKFCAFLGIQDEVKKVGHNSYICPLRWFSIFCNKLSDFNETDPEMREIHKNLTLVDWSDLFSGVGLDVKSLIILSAPVLILERLQRNIVLPSRRSLPPFSIHFVTSKRHCFFCPE